MVAKKKAEKAPLTRCGGTLTESAYLQWIRSALRSRSLRWPPRNAAIQSARRAYTGTNRLQKWEHSCAICKQWFKMKDVVVDHHPHAAGSILSVDDIGPFAERLFCEVDNLRVLCVECHDIHTLAEKQGITFVEARVEKEINNMMKSPQLLDFLKHNGYTGATVSNAEKRRIAVSNILKEKIV